MSKGNMTMATAAATTTATTDNTPTNQSSSITKTNGQNKKKNDGGKMKLTVTVRRKNVTFSNEVLCRLHLHHNDMSKTEIDASWYQHDDYQRMVVETFNYYQSVLFSVKKKGKKKTNPMK